MTVIGAKPSSLSSPAEVRLVVLYQPIIATAGTTPHAPKAAIAVAMKASRLGPFLLSRPQAEGVHPRRAPSNSLIFMPVPATTIILRLHVGETSPFGSQPDIRGTGKRARAASFRRGVML